MLSSTDTKYFVVEFQEDKQLTVDIVPDSWISKINGKDMCWWPRDTSKLTKLYKSKENPKEPAYSLYSCKIYAIKDSLLRAQHKLNKILDAGSDLSQALLTTDDEFLKRSRSSRKRKECTAISRNKFLKQSQLPSTSTFSQAELDDVSSEPSNLSDSAMLRDIIPLEDEDITFPNTSTLTSGLITPSSLIPLYSNAPKTPKSSSNIVVVKRNDAPMTQESFKPYFTTIMSAIKQLKGSVETLEKKLGGSQLDSLNKPVLMPDMFKEWPLMSSDQFQNQESILADLEGNKEAVDWIVHTILDKKWGQMTRNVLNSMLEVTLQQRFTFSEKTKSIYLKFESTKAYLLVKESIRKAHPSVEVVEIRACVQNWFQHKTDRKPENQRVKSATLNPV